MEAQALRLTQPLAHYCHVKRVGAMVYLAGQGARDPVTNQEAGVTVDHDGRITGRDIAVQTRAVLANMERALESCGLTRRDLVDVTVFLTDMVDFGTMNRVWNEFFDGGEPPTRTTVAVKTLPGRNFVEMKGIAFDPRVGGMA